MFNIHLVYFPLIKILSAQLILPGKKTPPPELQSTAIFVPDGCEESRHAGVGDMLSVHYTGIIHPLSASGKPESIFDSSIGRDPFDFQIGSGQVIKGWDRGLLGMCIGEKRRLVIPPDYGYGARGAGSSIPGGATLQFDVELIDIRDSNSKNSQEVDQNIFKEIDTDGDWLISNFELDLWFINMKGEPNGAPPGLFSRDDLDRDELISWEEFSGPKGVHGPPPDL